MLAADLTDDRWARIRAFVRNDPNPLYQSTRCVVYEQL